ncbi:probable cytochrome P450 6d4 [Teleopsis dalmanni]|uniref:probable cytochrome P450 6d4 n=1 Tax=Teleopsis dalmanni TaxID=139649 RepID=UPI0018CE7444|nr:probable cytochrome P450 6d4 [Teleopsis dalmanni]XP_037932795.1 probable cytochrome P450 6d4 [Teleopsis dalmanni]
MIILILVVLAVILFHYIKRIYSYWEHQNFPYDQNSKIPYGCLESVAKHKKSMGMTMYDVYLRSKERFLGVYLLFRPAILVRDVNLVRHILAEDFASFHDRGIYVDEEKDPLSANIFSLEGKSWRDMRIKLAPLFTSGKLKAMFSTSEEVGDRMIAHLNTLIPEKSTMKIDLKEIFTTYAIDIIGSTIFGLDINSFENPTNKFRNIVRLSHKNTHPAAILGMLLYLFPSLVKFLFRKFGLKNPVALEMLKIVKDTIEYREKHNIVRKDMLQLLMQLKNTGKIEEDDNFDAKVTKKAGSFIENISIETITAQAFVFYIAGQESTASAAALTIFELAQYPDILKKVTEEVNRVLAENNGKITYETLQKMEYLELCINETLRKYPSLPLMNRICTQDYQIPGSDKIIKKGTNVLISLFGIHRDPEHFPDPEIYIPERFLPENSNYNPKAYMPFGEGPRHCIAQRMGKINSKLGVVKILQNFNIEIMPKQDIEIDNYSILIVPKGGVNVRLSKK